MWSNSYSEQMMQQTLHIWTDLCRALQHMFGSQMRLETSVLLGLCFSLVHRIQADQRQDQS